MQNRIIYAGTFDPIHNGHVDLIKRISKQYHQVIVAVAEDTGDKKPSCSYQDRLKIVKQAIEELKLNNVEVEGFKGKAADFAVEKNASAILRGLRDENDFKAESTFSRVNRALKPIDVILLVSDPEYDEVSSTKVRMNMKQNKDIYNLVPDNVAKSLNTSTLHSIQNVKGSSINWKYKLTDKAIIFWQKNKTFLKGAACGFVTACILGSSVNKMLRS